MIHPALRLVATQPQLLLEHAAAYGQLFSAELDEATRRWRRRALLLAVGLASASVCAILGGTSVMLAALAPGAANLALWALIGVPMAPAALALGCLFAWNRQDGGEPFANLKRQAGDDIALLGRAVGT